MTEWDANFSKNLAALANVEISRATVALFDLHFDNEVAANSLQLTLEPKEKKGVTSLVPLQKESLILVPVSTNISCTKHSAEPVPLQALPITCTSSKSIVYVQETTRREHKPHETTGCNHKTATPEFIAPFWLVGTTVKSSEANMKLQVMSQNLLDIPCLVNSKALKKGDVLKLYHDSSNNQRFGSFAAPNKRRKIGT